jgi:hypothetical protein
MTCEDVRPRLLDHRRGRMDAAADADLRSHLRGCDACTRAYAVEATLDELLSRRGMYHRLHSLQFRSAERVGSQSVG